MGQFLWPDWKPLPQDSPLPPPSPDPEQAIADNTRAEEALNQFIAARQNALFEAPDAFYRTQGSDAIHAAPAVTQALQQVRSNLLDGLANDSQRNKLASVLDAQMRLTRDGMARHVAEQSLAWQRKTAQDRIGLLTKEAAFHHNDEGLVDALGHAAANAARAHARVGGAPLDPQAEDAAAAFARSGVLGAAIQARLDRGDTAGANTLFTRVQDQLDPEHAKPLLPHLGQDSGAPAPPNDIPDDTNGGAPSNLQIAQASSVGQSTKSPAPLSAKLAISENERDAAQSSLAQQAAKAKAELDVLASTPRTQDDDKYKGPLPVDWEKRLPAATLKKLNESAAEYGVPRNLIAAILWEESTFEEKASASSTAEGQGMAGMSLGAQKDLITKAQLEKRPERESELKAFDRMKGPAAVSMSAEYLKQLYDDNDQHWPSAVLAYRLGRTAVHNWLTGTSDGVKMKTGRWEEGKTYLRRIFQGRSHLFDRADAPEYP
jgi:soluble lytic murein transglycosylase-like protein